MKITEIMNPKVLTILQDQPVSDAANLMRKYSVGGLVVLDEKGTLVGIVTSRDLRGVSAGRTVGETMSRELTVVQPRTSIWEALEIMNSARVERLPVVSADKLIGMVTRADLLTIIARHTDSLTGLYTAAYLRDMAQRLLFTAKEISIIFIDIDDFGLINKRFGHSEGDRCLRILANLLRKHSAPGEDFSCRFGGDEFAVVSTRPLNAAFNWAKNIKETVGNVCKPIPINISIGIAGGRRRKARAGTNAVAVIESLINLASLASTMAKTNNSGVEIAGGKTLLPN
ncbi:MAG: CBS domain-containing protein [Firmicutes bacterium]|nr:CBS domain-containing protein [Bacillota bacterium]